MHEATVSRTRCERGSAPDRGGIGGKLALAIALAGSYVAAIPRLRPDIRLYLLEYRE